MNRRTVPSDPTEDLVEQIRAATEQRLERARKKGVKSKPGKITVIRLKRKPGQPDWREIVAQIQEARRHPPEPGPHPSKLIDTFVREHLAPFLKAEGFRKNGRRFWRQTHGIIDVISVQKSQWNDAWEGSFCIELGVCPEKIQRKLNPFFSPDPPPPKVTIFRHRLTPDMKSDVDHWWKIKPGTALEPVAAEITGLLKKEGFPWLAVRHDPRVIKAEVASRWPDLIGGLNFPTPLRNRRKPS